MPADRGQDQRDHDNVLARLDARRLRRGHVKALQDWQDAGVDRNLIERAAELLEVEAPLAS